MNKARLIKALDGFKGRAALYELTPPMVSEDYDYDADNGIIIKEYRYVIVSAATAMFSGPETYIFPADRNGKVLDWTEVGGSYRGGLSHATALRNAGYEIEDTTP